MRKTSIVLLVLLVLTLAGWIAFERGGFDGADPVPPRGGDSERGIDEPISQSSDRAGPLLTADPAHEREIATAPDAQPTAALLLVRVTERGTRAVVEGASIALDPFGPGENPGEEDDPSQILLNPADETDAHTDNLGEALIEVPSGIRISMRVRCRGPAVGRSDHPIPALEPGERREVLVDLACGEELEHWVRAVTGSREEPLAGASVRLLFAGAPLPANATSPGDSGEPALHTGSDGLARLKVPSWKSALARIDARGYGPRIAALIPGCDAPARAQVVPLSLSASLTASVSSSPGIPLADASLVLSLPASEIAIPRGTTVLAGSLVWAGSTDQDGSCRIEDLPAEVPFRVEIRRGEEVLHRLADPWTFSPGEKAERSVCLGGAARLFGRLLGPESQPMAGVEIWLARVPAPLDPAAADPAEPQSTLHDRYFWTGTMEQPFATTRTDEGGSFSFEGLEWGDWWVGPAPVRATQGDGAAVALAPRAQLVRVPAGAREIEVVLRAGPGRWIYGKVVDPNDVAVAQAVVRARAVDALGSPSTRTAPDGTFALGPLAEGAFVLRAQGRWGWTDSAESTVSAGDRDVLLRLAPGATLRGRAIDRDTGAGCIATIYLTPAGIQGEPSRSEPNGAGSRSAIASAGRDGSFEFRSLVPGTYDLLGRSSDGRVGFLADVVVRLGESASPAAVFLAPGGKLRIRHEGLSAWGRYAVLCQGKVLAEGSAKAGTSTLVYVPAGTVTVRFSASGRPPVDREIEASPGEEETEVVFSSD
ncbi:MAG: hypothetical protein ACKVXR_05335 [Planctomycetota bacterium]